MLSGGGDFSPSPLGRRGRGLRAVRGLRAACAPHIPIALQTQAFRLQLLTGAEQVRVVRHIKHSQERDSPRILKRFLPDQDGHTAVDGFGQFGVPAAAEGGAGSGIRIYQPTRRGHLAMRE